MYFHADYFVINGLIRLIWYILSNNIKILIPFEAKKRVKFTTRGICVFLGYLLVT